MSARYRQLAAMTKGDLEEIFAHGQAAALDTVAGWEFRGYNHSPRIVDVLRIRTFIKGFSRLSSGDVIGYNTPVVQHGLSGDWVARRRHGQSVRARFFRAVEVQPGDLPGASGALLLDYGEAGNPPWEIARGLRDFLRHPSDGEDDLLLGKAYFALPGGRLHLNFFLLERHGRVPQAGPYGS